MDKTLEEQEEIQKAVEKKKLEEAQRKAKIVARSKYTLQQINPFDIYSLKPVKPRGWHEGKTLSEKQRETFLKYIGNPDDFPYHEAKQLLDHQFRIWEEGLCTLPMCRHLKRNGIDGTNMKKEVGHVYLDAIFSNNGRLPANFKLPVVGPKPPPHPSTKMNGSLQPPPRPRQVAMAGEIPDDDIPF